VDRPAQQTVVLAKSTKLGHGTELGRTLCYRADARAVIVGMTLYTTKAHIARATLEAVTLQVNPG